VVAVGDQAREHAVGGEQLPDGIRMPRQDVGAPVAEMRRQRRAGGDRVGDLCGGRRRMADRGADTRRGEMLDQLERAGPLGGERDEPDPSVSRLLTPAKVVHARQGYVLARMRAARPVGRRQMRTLRVDPGNRGIGDARQDARARREAVERRRDQRRQAAGHAGRAHAIQRFGRAIGGEAGAVEIDAGEPVHLKVEQSRQLDRPHTTG
jgi:hypothetical protein